jgi:acetylornithine deacetylase
MNSQSISRISAAVDSLRDRLVTFAQELVRIPSVTGSEGAVQAFVERTMRDAGLEVDVWEPDPVEMAPYSLHIGEVASFSGRPNVVGTLRGFAGGRSLILNAHIDVVDAGDPARWTHPPFSGTIEDGKLYGRGACDMKSGLAANLFALEAVRLAGIPLSGDVIVQSVISEEDGGAGAVAAILRGHTADAAIITEPTKLQILAAHCGSLVFRLLVPGKSAHGAVRDEGVSAVEKFAYLHRALLDFERERNAAIDHSLYRDIANKIPISVGVVRAGAWASSVPESLIAEGRAGLMPGETLDGFAREFVAAIDRAADADDWLREHRPVVEWFGGQFEPSEVPVDSPIARLVAAAHASAHGSVAAFAGATYGADMRHFVNLGKIPCVMYGAGDVRVAHYTDEFVPLDEVVALTKTLAVAIARWCGTSEPIPAA